LADLRSYIEGFAPLLDDESHSQSRRLEAKFRWLYRALSGQGELERIHDESDHAVRYFKEMCALSQDLFPFVEELSFKERTDELQAIQQICEKLIKTLHLNLFNLSDRVTFMETSFACQHALRPLLIAKGYTTRQILAGETVSLKRARCARIASGG
jgi:hypothetical protein